MKRFIFGFLAIFFLIFNILPSVYLFANGGYTNTQYAHVGSLLFSNLITSGEATELDFSDYTGSGTDLLIALGEMAVTGDVTGLVDYGLEWLGDTADDVYQNAIESIREWEYNIAPDLYNWWYNGSQYEFKLEPIKASGLALRQLLTPPDNTPTPQPNPDFSFISNINNFYNTSGLNLMSNTFQLYESSTRFYFTKGSIKDTTFCAKDFVLSQAHIGGVSGQYTPIYSLNDICTINVLTNQNNTIDVVYTTSSIYTNYIYYLSNNTPRYWQAVNIKETLNSNNDVKASALTSMSSFTGYPYTRSSFDDMSTCMNYLYQHYCNVNLYVDGVPWALASTPTYPIVIDDLLSVLNDIPAIYNYPYNTYIDLSSLQTIITDAIDDSDVLTYNDIKPVFVDVNGQEAVAVVQIYRNDYDNMYPEQLPLIILPDDENYFSVHLLDTSKQYLQTQVDVVENTVDVLPSHLVGVLAIGCILTIFACIIHRLLE